MWEWVRKKRILVLIDKNHSIAKGFINITAATLLETYQDLFKK